VATKVPHLAQEWVHSHEEDKGGETVFRPPTYKFPLSRGRSSFDLKSDGKLVEKGPGPTDRTQSQEGEWSVSGKTLTLKKPGQSPRVFEIASAEPDKLVLKETSS
jgi:hypothetical protein